MDEHHNISIPAEVNTQKEKAKDLQLIFSDRVKVQFTAKDGKVSTVAGRWCMLCKYVINFLIANIVNSPRIKNNAEFIIMEGK